MADAFLMGNGGGKKLVGDAQVNHVLAGKTFSNAVSNTLTGTMPNRGKVDNQLAINGSFTIPQGYHDGTGTVFQSVTTKGSQTYTPGTTPQTIAANQYLTGVQTIEGDADLIAANIKAGVTIFGVTGTAPIPGGTAGAAQILAGYTFINSAGVEVTGTIPSKLAATYTPGTTNQTIAAGQYLSGVQTIAGDADLVSANIKAGANIFGVAGKSSVVDTVDASADPQHILAGYTAYSGGSKKTGTIINRSTQSAHQDTLEVQNGVYTSGNTNIRTYFRPPAGYYDGVTWVAADNPNLVSANIKAGASILGVSGKSTVVDTEDANANANQILTGYGAYVNGSKITGTMPVQGQKIQYLSTHGQKYTIPLGYHTGDGFVQASISNLSAENIKSGVNVGGVIGNLIPLTNEKKWATGTATPNSNVYDFYFTNGNVYNNLYAIVVSGLTFKPSTIIAFSAASELTLYTSTRVFNGKAAQVYLSNYATNYSSTRQYVIDATVAPVYVTTTGFLLPARNYNDPYTWLAIE